MGEGDEAGYEEHCAGRGRGDWGGGGAEAACSLAAGCAGEAGGAFFVLFVAAVGRCLEDDFGVSFCGPGFLALSSVRSVLDDDATLGA